MKTFLLITMLILGTGQPALAQDESGWTFGIGGGGVLVVGTPQRPAPQGEDRLTGAGIAPMSWHAQLLLERRMSRWLNLRGLVFTNRFVTPRRTFNCLGTRSDCYPAAQTDRLVGALFGPRAAFDVWMRPSIDIALGVGKYEMKNGDEWFPLVEDVANIRPLYKIGAGSTFELLGLGFVAETGLQGSFGNGGGVARIPITLTLLFH